MMPPSDSAYASFLSIKVVFVNKARTTPPSDAIIAPSCLNASWPLAGALVPQANASTVNANAASVVTTAVRRSVQKALSLLAVSFELVICWRNASKASRFVSRLQTSRPALPDGPNTQEAPTQAQWPRSGLDID